MYNEESASLVLRTSDLPNGTNNIGSSDQFYTNMTWSNISLRTLLGSMYEKYDKFAFPKYVIFQKYEYAFPKYDWPKGKYAHTW